MAPKLPVYSKVSIEDLADAPKGRWLDAITSPLNDSLSSSKVLLSGGLTFGQNLACDIKDLIIDIPDVWSAMTLVNGYTNNAPPREQAAYMKHPDGTVEIRLSLTGGAGFTIMSTLPVGYRPLYDIYATGVTGAAAINRIQIIASTGAIIDGTGAGTADLHFRFLSSDATPVPNVKFPLNFSTKFDKPPLAVFIASVEDMTATETKKLGCVMTVDWEYGTVNGTPNIKIKNICGLPYNRKYKLKLIVIGG